MSHVVISGYYGSKNAGDEAMLAAMVEVLSDLNPKVHITVISADPEDTKKRHGVEAIGWLDFCGIIGALRQADVLLSGGGSLLQNITSRRSLYYYLVIIWLAQLCSTPVMLYAQGIGPISGRIARWVMRHNGNRVKMITVRDRGSLQELAELAGQLKASGKGRAYQQVMSLVTDFDMVNARLDAVLKELMIEEDL